MDDRDDFPFHPLTLLAEADQLHARHLDLQVRHGRGEAVSPVALAELIARVRVNRTKALLNEEWRRAKFGGPPRPART